VPDCFDSFEGIYTISDGVLGIKDGGLKQIYASIRLPFHEAADRSILWRLGLVTLLATTEHLTLINLRKRLIEQQPDLLLEELRILNILFSSPLQKHTKSPMLWQHRRWILGKVLRIPQDKLQDLPILAQVYSEIWDSTDRKDWTTLEILTVIRAGELHPRNYYAWAYARWMLKHLPVDLVELAEKIFATCKRQVSDISSWSFLDHVLQLNGDVVLRRDYAERAFAMTRIVARHEALWWFIRVSIVKSDAQKLVYDISESTTTDKAETQLRVDSLVWIKRMATRGKKHRRSSSPINDRRCPNGC
jgi:hypothetical protein